MPTFRLFKYKCETCGKPLNAFHDVQEAFSPSAETIQKLTRDCGLKDECKPVPAYKGPPKQSASIARFSMMSPEEKKQALQKRSNEHFEKKVKPYAMEKFKRNRG